MAEPSKNDIVAELTRYNEVSKRNKEYLLHTKLGDELFLKYSADEANRIIDVLSSCLTVVYMEPGSMKLALKATKNEFSRMTSNDERLVGMLDDNIGKMYDVVERKPRF